MQRFAVIVSALALSLVWAGPALAQAEHCPGEPGGNEFKAESSTTFVIDGTEVNVNIAGDTVTFTDENGDPISVSFCVKAGEQSSGALTGTAFTVNWTNGGGQTPDISYVVVYEVSAGAGGNPPPPPAPPGGGGVSPGGAGGGGGSLGGEAGSAGAGALPFTGMPIGFLAGAGLALILGGLALRRTVRRDG